MATHNPPPRSAAILILLKALCVLTFFASINYSDETWTRTTNSRPLSSNHPQYAYRRHLLSDRDGDFIIYLQTVDGETGELQTVAVEAGKDDTVGDLYRIAQTVLNVNCFELRFQDRSLRNRHEALADTGLSAESTIAVDPVQNDIICLFSMFDERSMQAAFSGRQIEKFQEIREMIEESARSGVEDVNIRQVAQRINWHTDFGDHVRIDVNRIGRPGGHGSRLDYDVKPYGLSRIDGTDDIDEDGRVKTVTFWRLNDGVHLQWGCLPPQTVMLKLVAGSVTSIDFRGIACEYLASIELLNMYGLNNLDLRGLERCGNLKTIAVLGYNPELYSLDLAPLRGCRNLETLRLECSNLMQLDLSPLAESDSLRVLGIYKNEMFKAGSENWQRLIAPLKHLTEKKEHALQIRSS